MALCTYMHVAFTVNALARGVTCYFGACRNQTHISRVPLSCHRYKTAGQAAICKRSSLAVLFMTQRHAVALNGTLQIGTIYGFTFGFSAESAPP